MADPNIDYAVIGEGEVTAGELDRAIRTGGSVDGIDGLAWRDNGSVRINPRQRYIEDLDAMPFPAWDLIDIPRYRDFRGINPKAFDGRGNYSLGLTEQIVFPEISYDKVTRVNGMNIAFVTTAGTDAEGRALLASLGMPFRQ